MKTAATDTALPILLLCSRPENSRRLRAAFRQAGAAQIVLTRGEPDALPALLDQASYALVVLVDAVPADRALQRLRMIMRREPALPVVVITDAADARRVLRFCEAGAFDCLTRTQVDAGLLPFALRRALNHSPEQISSHSNGRGSAPLPGTDSYPGEAEIKRHEIQLQNLTEELQAANEELQVTNEDLQVTNEDLSETNDRLAEEIRLRRQVNLILLEQNELLDLARDAIIVRDLEDRCVYWNLGAERMYGYTRQEAAGQVVHELLKAIVPVPIQQIKQWAVTRSVFEAEQQQVTKDGRRIVVSSQWAPKYDEQGNLAGFLQVNRDITARKRDEEQLQNLTEELHAANEELQASNEELRVINEELSETNDRLAEEIRLRQQANLLLAEQAALLELAHDCILTTDEQDNILFWNRGAERTYGFSREDAVGQKTRTLIHTRYPVAYEALKKQLLEQGTWEGELEHTTRDGRRLIMASRWAVRYDERGRMTGFLQINRDITEKKQAQDELLSAALFPAENPNPVLRISREGELLYGNAAAESLVTVEGGVPAAPLLEQALASLQRAERSEFEMQNRDGRVISFACMPLPERGYVNLYGRDITARRQAEEELRRSREDLNRAQAVAHTGSWRLDVRRNELLWSDETYRLFGIPQGTPLTYEMFLDKIHPDDREFVSTKWMAALRGEPYDIEHRIVVGEDIKWIRERAELEISADGSLQGGFGTAQDITARKQTEEALRTAHAELEQKVQERTAELKTAMEAVQNERKRFRDVLDELPAYVCLLTPDYHAAFANRVFRDRFGEAHGKRCFEFLFDRTEPCEICETYKSLRENRPLQWEWTGPDQRQYSVFDFPFTDADGSPLILEMGIDVTDQRLAEAEIRTLNAELEQRVAARTQELSNTTEQLRTILENLSQGVVVSDLAGHLFQWNPAAMCMHGFKTPEEADHYLADFSQIFELSELDGTILPLEQWPLARVLAGEEFHDWELRVRRLHSDWERIFSYGGNLVRDAAGEALLAVVAVGDVTERKRAEGTLKRTLERFELLAASAGELLRTAEPQRVVEGLCTKVMEHLDCHVFFNFMVDPAAHRLHLNAYSGIAADEAARIEWLDFGQAVCGLAAKHSRRVVVHHIQNTVEPAAQIVKAYGVQAYCAHPLLGPDGKILGTLSFGTRSRDTFSEDDLALMKAVADHVAVAVARVQAEAALRESEERYRRLIEQLQEGIWQVDDDGLTTFVNPHMAQMLGGTAADIIGRSMFDFLAPEQGLVVRERMAWRRLGISETGEMVLRRMDGAHVHVVLHSRPLLDAQGNYAGALAAVMDITERKHAEEALQQSELKYRTFFENMSELLLILRAVRDAAGTIVDWEFIDGNAPACALYGWGDGVPLGCRLSTVTSPEELAERIQHSVELLETGVPRHYETQRAGRHFFTSVFRMDADTIAITALDLTERKQAEEALQKSKEELRRRAEELETLMNVAPVALWVANDPQCTDIRGNVMANRFYEAREGENVSASSSVARRFFRDGVELEADELPMQQAATQAKDIRNDVLDVLLPSGNWLQMHGSASPLRDADGHIRGAIGAFVDVTARKQAEDALRESEARYRRLVQTAPVPIVVFAKGRILYVNTESLKLVGVPDPDGLVGRRATQFIHLEDREALRRLFRSVEETRHESEIIEFRLLRADGEERMVELVASPTEFDGEPAVQTVIRDITEQKRAEAALTESQERFRKLAEASFEGLLFHEAGAIFESNSRLQEMFGYDEAEIAGKRVLDLVAVEDTDFMQRRLRSSLNDRYEVRGRRKDGTSFPLEVLDRSLQWNGRPSRVLALRDISQRKDMELALRESEERYRRLIEESPNAVFVVSDGKIVFTNRAALQLFDAHQEEEVAGLQFLDIIDPAVRATIRETLAALDQVSRELPTLDYRLVRRNGVVVDVEGRPIPFVYQGRSAVLHVAQDVTERKRIEEQIRRHGAELERLVEERTAQIRKLELQRREYEKLAAVGRMAARVAHEINNPLAGVKNSFLLVKRAIPTDFQYYDFVGRIEREIERIARIVRQMFELYRPEQKAPNQFHPATIIRDVAAMLDGNLRAQGVQMEFDIEAAARPICLHEDSLRQVLFSIIQNAIEASKSGGFIRVRAAVTDDALSLAIEDNGCGIPDDVRAHIFEPFFTTKSGLTTGGLGLGLSITKGVIEAMGGTLAFDSVVGQGTTFHIHLPVHIQQNEVTHA